MSLGNLIWLLLNSFIGIFNTALLVIIPIVGSIWINKKRAKIDKELEGIKSSLLKEQFIHQKQFEKELKVYQDLWKHLVTLKEAIEMLFPVIDYIEPGKSEEETKRDRLNDVQKAY